MTFQGKKFHAHWLRGGLRPPFRQAAQEHRESIGIRIACSVWTNCVSRPNRLPPELVSPFNQLTCWYRQRSFFPTLSAGTMEFGKHLNCLVDVCAAPHVATHRDVNKGKERVLLQKQLGNLLSTPGTTIPSRPMPALSNASALCERRG